MPWDVNGNAITGTNFLGTTNPQPLVIKTNNSEAMRVLTDGSVGIGTTAPIGHLGVYVGDGLIAVQGEANGTDPRDGSAGIAVYGHCPPGVGVFGDSDQDAGVQGQSSDSIGVFGDSFRNEGVRGQSQSSHGGVVGLNSWSPAISDQAATDGAGVYGQAAAFEASGVYGSNGSGIGVSGRGIIGVNAEGDGVAGVVCRGTEYGIWTQAGSPGALAGVFDGNVSITGSGAQFTFALGVSGDVYIGGTLNVVGPINKMGGGFRIDHPIDPTNKYLTHSFVESSERKMFTMALRC